LFISFVLGVLFFLSTRQGLDLSVLENYRPGKPSILLDEKGREWGRFQLDKREPISLQKMPKYLIQAFIASEDHKFFEHVGISWKGIIRSTLINLYHWRIVQGASTITQQLVKLLFFDSKRTFVRKIKEQFLSLLIERQFTKEQILETYLNHVYFGCGIYGVEAASQRFWKKYTSDLDASQAALLAAIVKSPIRYCPLISPLSGEKRRNLVLSKMFQLGFITQKEYKESETKSMDLAGTDYKVLAPHAKETLRIFLESLVGKERLYSEGLTIQTTLNIFAQRQAEQHFKNQFNIIKKKLPPAADGALLSIDVSTGAIRALVGGYSFASSQVNRAFKAKRQVGSVLKPLVYSVALQEGACFSDTKIDEPLSFSQGGHTWEPRNVYRIFEGEMTLSRALSYSNNIITIKTLLDVGVQKVINLAKKCGVSSHLPPYPSLALGCADVTLDEAAGMFNVFANGGVYVEPHLVKWVKDQWGKKIWKVVPKKRRALSYKIASQVTQVLTFGLKRLRKKIPYKWIKSEAISKTGTTNDSRVCWFAASTPRLTTVICVGCDDNSPLGKNVYPVHTAFPIWLGLQRDLDLKEEKFVSDPSLKKVVVHEKTGKTMKNEESKDSIVLLV
jgi:penicillin-binding protein 1A